MSGHDIENNLRCLKAFTFTFSNEWKILLASSWAIDRGIDLYFFTYICMHGICKNRYEITLETMCLIFKCMLLYMISSIQLLLIIYKIIVLKTLSTWDFLKTLLGSQFEGYEPSLYSGQSPWMVKSVAGFPVLG